MKKLFILTASVVLTEALNISAFATEWLPADGAYAVPGPNHSEQCLEFGDLTLDRKRMIRGESEGSCKIENIVRLSIDKIILKMLCSDIVKQRPHKGSALVKRVDENTIIYRETESNVWRRPGAKNFIVEMKYINYMSGVTKTKKLTK